MLNRPGFIPAKYRQPDGYQLIFENWTAIFNIGGCEYHIELAADWRNKKTARGVDILCQGADCRNTLFSGIPSIKQALEMLEKIIQPVDETCSGEEKSRAEPNADAL